MAWNHKRKKILQLTIVVHFLWKLHFQRPPCSHSKKLEYNEVTTIAANDKWGSSVTRGAYAPMEISWDQTHAIWRFELKKCACTVCTSVGVSKQHRLTRNIGAWGLRSSLGGGISWPILYSSTRGVQWCDACKDLVVKLTIDRHSSRGKWEMERRGRGRGRKMSVILPFLRYQHLTQILFYTNRVRSDTHAIKSQFKKKKPQF